MILSYFHLSYNWCLLRQLSRSRPSYTKANGFYLAHCNRGQSTCCFRFSSKRIPLSSNNSVFQSFDLVLSHHHKSSHLLDHLTTHRPSFALKISPSLFLHIITRARLLIRSHPLTRDHHQLAYRSARNGSCFISRPCQICAFLLLCRQSTTVPHSIAGIQLTSLAGLKTDMGRTWEDLGPICFGFKFGEGIPAKKSKDSFVLLLHAHRRCVPNKESVYQIEVYLG